MTEKHTDAEILAVFRDIDAGKFHNASFSDANVIMMSREHYAAMQDLFTNLRNHTPSDSGIA